MFSNIFMKWMYMVVIFSLNIHMGAQKNMASSGEHLGSVKVKG